MGGIGQGVTTWIVVAVLSVLALFVLTHAVRSMLHAARQPARTVSALRLHDQAAGSLGKGFGIAAVLICGLIIGDGDWAGISLWIGAAVALLVLILIEQRWPAPGGTVRSAILLPRRLVEILPRAGTMIAGVGVLTALGGYATWGLIGAEDSEFADPVQFAWPTWRHIAPELIGLAAVLVLTGLAIALLLRRPALAGFTRAVDLVYRRTGVDRALRVVAFVGFLQTSLLLHNMEVAGRPSGTLSMLHWVSLALFCVAVVSVVVLRVRPPKQLTTAEETAYSAVSR